MSRRCGGMSLAVGPRARKTRTVVLEVTLRVNGAPRRLVEDTRTTVLDALFEPVKPAVAHQDATIVTIEGPATADHLGPFQRAFVTYDAFQCGYSTPSEMRSAVGMLPEAIAGQPSALS